MRNKEMKLQLFAQTWNPDNVTVFEHKEGLFRISTMS